MAAAKIKREAIIFALPCIDGENSKKLAKAYIPIPTEIRKVKLESICLLE
jgi:hypothetical protein